MNSKRTMARKSAGFRGRKSISLLVAGLVLVFLCLPAFAQINLGRIFGAITDQTGGAIVGATVTITDVARGVSRPLITDGAGEYSAPSLIPGTYTVRAEAKGFKVLERKDIDVGVGKDVRVDLTLQPGEQSQTVTVTGELPLVNTADAQLGGTLDNTSVEELPVNGRNYQYLLGFRPGLFMQPTGGQSPFISNGTRGGDAVFLIDGVMDDNLFSGTSIVGGASLPGGPDQVNILPLDAIQEVDIVENPKAEFGNKDGAQVNVGLKSGTNSIHGTAYAFGRDTGLNAKNPYLLSTEPKAPLALEQFGASIGGPIKKDRVFYFANYEGQRFTVGTPRLVNEPTTATGAGSGSSIPDAIFDILHNGGNTAAIPPSALSLNLAGCAGLVPAGSVGANGFFTPAQITALAAETPAQLASGCNAAAGLFGNSGSSATEVTDLLTQGGSDNGIIKIDLHPNDKNSLNFEFYTGGGIITAASSAIQPYWAQDFYSWSNIGRAVWIWTPSSTLVNEMRFGYEYANAPEYLLECAHPGIGPNYAALGFISGAAPCSNPSDAVVGGFPVTSISGFGALGANALTEDSKLTYYTIHDSVSYTRGTHVFKFGGEGRIMPYFGGTPQNGRGVLNFGTTAAWATNSALPACKSPNPSCPGATALEDFLTGVTSPGQLLVGYEALNYSLNEFAFFAQDDWRILPRLTLNLGVRYENTLPLTEKTNGFGNIDPTLNTATDLVQATSSHPTVYKDDALDFMPRLGLAWDVFGKGKTVVNAGFSVLDTTAVVYKSLISKGAILPAIPTGFTFVKTNGTPFAGPGNITEGNIALAGGVPGTASDGQPWAVNKPVFNAGPSSLQCGDGLPIPGSSPAQNYPAPCVLNGINTNMKWPIVYGRSLGVQHAFTNNLSINVAYVGNHGTRLDNAGNINVPTLGAKNSSANGFIEQARRPYNTQFPFYADMFELSYQDISNYDSLQLALNQRVSRGLTFSAGYTYSHSLDEGGVHSQNMDPLHILLDYGNASADVRNILTFTATYVIPGRKSPGQMLQGWQLNTSVNNLGFTGGFPVAAGDTTNDLSGTGQLLDRWTLVGDPHAFQIGGPGLSIPCYGVTGSSFSKATNCTTVAAVTNMPALCQSAAAAEAVNPNLPAGTANATGTLSLASFGCYFIGSSAIVPPAQGTFGTMARDALQAKAFHNWDMSVTKNWKLKERYGVQFRAEFFNVLNRTQYSSPNANLAAPASFGQAAATPDSGNPVIGSGARKIQFGAKLSF
jgi:hypothetical protein